MPDKVVLMRSLEFVSPLTAVVFAAVGWLVFAQLFDTREPAALPALTRSFLGVQPWWLAAGLLGATWSAIAALRNAGDTIKQGSAVYSGVLAVINAIGIGWGIAAMYLLTLPPASL